MKGTQQFVYFPPCSARDCNPTALFLSLFIEYRGFYMYHVLYTNRERKEIRKP
jgi:hypothetical protein